MKITAKAGALLKLPSETVLPAVSGSWKSGAFVPRGSIVELTATMKGMWNESEWLSMGNQECARPRAQQVVQPQGL